MAEVFNVTKRSESGRQANKRLRRQGHIPAILYGHKEESISLTISRDEVNAALRHSGKVVELRGDVAENALIREVQWDTYGIEVLHLDLIRVSMNETRDITVSLKLKGEAPGTREGGILNFVTHEIDIACPVAAMPEQITVNIGDLQLGGAIHASEVELPQGAKLLTDGRVVIVNCVAPAAEEETGVPGAAAEPELIRKPKEGEEGE
jgi:large subunit ribosomal protein L25